NTDLVFPETQDPLAVHARDTDDAVLECGAVHRPLAAVRIAEDRGDRSVPCKAEVGEGPVVPDGRGCELLLATDRIVRVRRIGRDGPGRLDATLGIAELHDVMRGLARLDNVEVVGTAVRIDRDVGRDA